MPSSKYSELNAESVSATLSLLHHRIGERFPEAGMLSVCRELQEICDASMTQLEWIRTPSWPLRILTALLIAVIVAVIIVSLGNLRVTEEAFNLTNFVDAVQNIIQDLLYVAVAVFFLLRMEALIKRRRVLRALHSLRSIAHVTTCISSPRIPIGFSPTAWIPILRQNQD